MLVVTLSTPFRILPPATPPFKSSTSQPGLFTSNDRITAKQQVTLSLMSFTTLILINKNNRKENLQNVGLSNHYICTKFAHVRFFSKFNHEFILQHRPFYIMHTFYRATLRCSIQTQITKTYQ